MKKIKLTKLGKVVGAFVLGGVIIFGMGTAIGNLIDTAFGATPRVSSVNETLERSAKLRAEGKDVSVQLSGDQILQTMNQMTHQKVHASDKWGAVEMSPKNIEEMIIVVEHDTTLDEGTKMTLLSILEGWMMGNFGSIVADHNAIWRIQGGTIGEATGTMSEQEEKEFVEKAFED